MLKSLRILIKTFFLIFYCNIVLTLKNCEIKINLGSGGTKTDGDWILTDINILDITKRRDWIRFLGWNRAHRMMAEHVWEHLNVIETKKANKNCHSFLRKGGAVRIAVPDGFHPDPYYIKYVEPGGSGPGAKDHKQLYTYKTLAESLKESGFTVNLLEYWDENGEFHATEWDIKNGFIKRSLRFDDRNVSGDPVFTSLIVDAIKY